MTFDYQSKFYDTSHKNLRVTRDRKTYIMIFLFDSFKKLLLI